MWALTVLYNVDGALGQAQNQDFWAQTFARPKIRCLLFNWHVAAPRQQEARCQT